MIGDHFLCLGKIKKKKGWLEGKSSWPLGWKAYSGSEKVMICLCIALEHRLFIPLSKCSRVYPKKQHPGIEHRLCPCFCYGHEEVVVGKREMTFILHECWVLWAILTKRNTSWLAALCLFIQVTRYRQAWRSGEALGSQVCAGWPVLSTWLWLIGSEVDTWLRLNQFCFPSLGNMEVRFRGSQLPWTGLCFPPIYMLKP